MSNNTEPLEIDDEDRPPQGSNDYEECEVKKKPICPSFHIYLFIILGSVLILLGIIDMIVFYVVPYKEINQNKKKYPNYEFEKPFSGITAVHFLVHIFLIIIGVMFIVSIYDSFYTTSLFLELIIIAAVFFFTLYILEVIFSAVFIKMITKEDYTLSQVSEILNLANPINSIFFFVKGTVRGSKGKRYTCYSKNGFALPVKSRLEPPNFDPKDYEPDFFFLKTYRKVNMSVQLLKWVEEGKKKNNFLSKRSWC